MANAFHYEGFSSPNGTIVPDDVFDVLAPQLKEAELRVLLYIIRRTFGFKKDRDSISLKQMVEGIRTKDGRILDLGAGVAKSAATRAVQGLEDKGIIVVTRNRSAAKGDEPTTYQLRFRSDPVFSKRTRGGTPKEQEGVLLEDTQETELQETVEQQTGEKSLPRSSSEISHSNIRIGTASQEKTGNEKPNGTESAPARPHRAQGFTSTRAVLAQRVPQRRTPEQSHDRQVILAYLHDFALEFGDKAPLKSSVTRAFHLFQRSGVDLNTFIATLHEARSVTKERTNSIHGSPGLKNKMPYFFGVLEDVLGLREHPGESDETPRGTRDGSLSRDRSSRSFKPHESQRPRTREQRPTVGGPYVRVRDGRPVVPSDGPDHPTEDLLDTPARGNAVRREHGPIARRSSLGPYVPVVSRRAEADDDRTASTLKQASDAPESRQRGRRGFPRPGGPQ